MAVRVYIQFGGQFLTLPVNPQEINISRSMDNEDLDIIGLGKTARKGAPGLITTSIESFIPGPNSYFYTGVKPASFVKMMERILTTEIQGQLYVPRFITSGLPHDLDMYFVIENFEYDHRAGEEEDVYYRLDIKQYIPYGVKTVKTSLSGLAAARAVSPAVSAPAQNTTQDKYIVKKGDCLWSISKGCCGDGNRWRELYNLNKSVIGSNPNLIYPGQVFTLPAGWKGNYSGAASTPKTTSTAKKTTTKKTATTTTKKATTSSTSKTGSQNVQKPTTKSTNRYNRTVSTAANKIILKPVSSGGGSGHSF